MLTEAISAGQLLAREYARVSRDKSGREKSIDEQHDANTAAVERQGWTMGDPYSDVGSASPWARKARGDFDQLVADLEADRFGAQILVLFASDRGSREVGEWSRLLKLLDVRAVQVFVTTHDRLYNPRIRRDWKTIIEDAVDAEDYSRKLSETVLRASSAAAADGEVWGPVPYGHRRQYNPRTGDLVCQEADPVESPVVAELIDRLYEGQSLMSIEKNFDARGLRSRSGKKLSAQYLREIALNPAHSGLRVHDPERWRHKTRLPWRTESATVVKAVWPAIVDTEKHAAVIQKFSERRTGRRGSEAVPRPGRAVHLLTWQPGILCGAAKVDTSSEAPSRSKLVPASGSVPGVCSSMLTIKNNPAGELQYRCGRHAHVIVPAADLDRLVTATVLEFLSRTDNFQHPEGQDAELKAVRKALIKERAEHDGLANLSVGLAAKMEPPILARIADLERQERDLTRPAELDGPLHPGDDIAVRWKAAVLPAKRDMIRLLLSPNYLGLLWLSQAGGNRWHTPPLHERMAFSCPISARPAAGSN